MIADFPNSEIATGRRIREYSIRMKSIRNLVQAQAFFHATPDHEEKYATGSSS